MVAKRSDLDTAAMRKQRATGATFREVAERHGCSIGTAWKIARIPPRPAGQVAHSSATVLEGGVVVAGRVRGNLLSTVERTDPGK